jgi:hypothetical protein
VDIKFLFYQISLSLMDTYLISKGDVMKFWCDEKRWWKDQKEPLTNGMEPRKAWRRNNWKPQHVNIANMKVAKYFTHVS